MQCSFSTDGDPDLIRENVSLQYCYMPDIRHLVYRLLHNPHYYIIHTSQQMRLKLANKDLYVTREGTEELPTIAFRQVA